MKKNKLIYIGVATLLSFSACSQGQPDEQGRAGSEIRFAPALSDIAWSRAADVTYDNFYSFQATCFNPAYPVLDENGILKPYFEDIAFGRIAPDVFVTTEPNCDWPDQLEPVDFIAFAPSRSAMAEAAGISIDEYRTHFAFINKTTVKDGKAVYDYSIADIRIADGIASQFDFLTAAATGSKFSSINDPVTLPFNHSLAKVQLRVWGKSPVYRIEIAGVRLGGMPLQGTYNFAPGKSPGTRWTVADDAPRNKAEYIFRTNDRVIVIDKNADNPLTDNNPASIMGEGGDAMMIPFAHKAWNHRAGTNDTGGAYFSVLMRVSNLKNDNQVAYPYADDNASQKIWLAVKDDGLVTKRLYRASDGTFYTDEQMKSPYAGNDPVREYGWAAVPVDIDWIEGEHYIYTLDYTMGLGVKDPDDSNPGELILGDPQVNMSVNVAGWGSGGNTNTVVPRNKKTDRI